MEEAQHFVTDWTGYQQQPEEEEKEVKDASKISKGS